MLLDNATKLLVSQIERLSRDQLTVGDVKSLCAALKTVREISSDELENREKLARIQAMERSVKEDSPGSGTIQVVFAPEVEDCAE